MVWVQSDVIIMSYANSAKHTLQKLACIDCDQHWKHAKLVKLHVFELLGFAVAAAVGGCGCGSLALCRFGGLATGAADDAEDQNNWFEIHDVIQVAIVSAHALSVSSNYSCPTNVATPFKLTSSACKNSAMVTSCLCGMFIGLDLVCIDKE